MRFTFFCLKCMWGNSQMSCEVSLAVHCSWRPNMGIQKCKVCTKKEEIQTLLICYFTLVWPGFALGQTDYAVCQVPSKQD